MKNIFISRIIKKFVITPFLFVIIFVSLSFSIIHLTTSPSNDRDWNDDQKILPTATIEDNFITINNIRNFTYASTTSYSKNYYNKTFDLNTIESVWYIVEPFEGIPGSAHTFLSFEFENNNFLAISIEIRKEKGETFNPIKGLFNRYELTYVVANENDVIKLRTNYRKDLVYLYKTTSNKEKTRALFLDMIYRINTLKNNPEFYNTVTNNCTTNIIKHINTIAPKRIPVFSIESIFPEYSDRLAYNLGLLSTSLSLEETRKVNLINSLALRYADDEKFSEKIRHR
jgi:hypothetical protein